MIESAQLSFEEKELLLQHFRKSQSVLIRERAQAILLSGKGFKPYDIAQVIFRDEKTVREWLKAFTKERIASLFLKYLGNENAAKSTRRQKEQIRQVLAKPPSEYGLPKEFWEVKSLRKYLLAEFGIEYKFEIPWQNGEEIIRILKKLKKIYLNKHLCLIWDNASFHKTKKLKEKLKTSLKAFYLLNLPPYAPDTNPQEHVWKYAKDEISNNQCATMRKMTERFKEIVMGRNYPYQI